MRTFAGRSGARKQVLFTLGLIVVVATISVTIAWREPNPTEGDKAVAILFAAVMVALGWLLVRYEGYEAWATYTLDDVGICKRTWFGDDRLEWSAVTECSLRGAIPRTYRLRDGSACTLRIPLAYLGRAHEIERILNERLGPVIARMLRKMRSDGRVFYPDRGPIACTVALLSVATLPIVPVVLYFPQHPDDPPWAREVAAFVFGVAAFGLGLLALYLRMCRLRIDGVAVSLWTPFRSRRIDLANLASIERRRHINQGRATDVITLNGGGTMIRFSSNMEDFVLVVEFLRSVAPHADSIDHTTLPPNRAQRQHMGRRRTRYRLATSLILAALGLALVLLGSATIVGERALDAHGVPATGRVVHQSAQEVSFAFVADGKLYEGRSPVARPDLASVRVGRSIDVVYLPDNPRIARASISNAARRALVRVIMGVLSILVAAWAVVNKPRPRAADGSYVLKG